VTIFFGEIETELDAKNRLAIPASFREAVLPDDGPNWIVIPGLENGGRCLWLYPDRLFTRLQQELLKPSAFPTEQATMFRMFFARAKKVISDAQGRIIIPEQTLEWAKLGDKITLIGNYEHLEAWPTADWQRRVESEYPTYGARVQEAGQKLRAASSNQKLQAVGSS